MIWMSSFLACLPITESATWMCTERLTALTLRGHDHTNSSTRNIKVIISCAMAVIDSFSQVYELPEIT